MVKKIQYLLIGLFILICLFIFIPSFLVLLESQSDKTSTAKFYPEFPTPPTPLLLEALDKDLDPTKQEAQAKIYQQRAIVFTQQVVVYTQQVNAYKAYMENAYKAYGDTTAKSRRLEVYETVVKDSMISLFSTLLATLVGYVFVKSSAEVSNNYMRAKNNQEVLPIKIWE